MKLTNEWVLGMCKHVSVASKDPNTKVGCIIMRDLKVLSVAWNEFPRGVVDSEDRRDRPTKYKYTEHAERNAIYDAAKRGVALDGATMYLSYCPCTECARAIICCGIRELVCYPPIQDSPWGEDFRIADTMLFEAAVNVTYEVKT